MHQVVNEELEASLAVAAAEIHQSACNYASVLLRGQPFGLRTYTEFTTHFCFLYNHLHKLRLRDANRQVLPYTLPAFLLGLDSASKYSSLQGLTHTL